MTNDPNASAPQPAPVPPGSEFAYDVAREQLSRALERINRADSKAGILVGILIAGVGAFLVLDLPFIARLAVGLPLLCSTVLVAASLLVTRVADAPDPQAVAHVVDSLPAEIKAALIPSLIDAYRRTSAQAARKERYLNWALAVTLVGAIVALAVKIIRG